MGDIESSLRTMRQLLFLSTGEKDDFFSGSDAFSQKIINSRNFVKRDYCVILKRIALI